jgi:tetratricopeptide (TPR) repeat protein
LTNIPNKMEVTIIDDPTPKLCLNMIEKNESKIIHRIMESVADIIDSYCICDTGSTDNTVELIQTFFSEKNIPGKIVQEPFRDFGYNRSFALKQCETMENADYILLLDADMIFWVNPKLTKTEFKKMLKSDAHYIYQGSDNFYYKNVRVVKNHRGIYYWGVTHEYVKTPEGSSYGLLDKQHVFIKDIGDGGAKSDKFERDIRLLKKGLEELPNNDRYTFYLANSYRDSGDNVNAIETYKKRIEIGGWHEEVWYSYYSIGKCYKNLGDMAKAVHYWMEGYQFFPQRVENLYEIVNHYRYIGKNQIAYVYCNAARKQIELHPNPDYLFLHRDVYDYKMDYEMTIIGYYCNIDNHDLGRLSMKILAKPNVESGIFSNVLSNYKFYTKAYRDWELPFSDYNVQLLKDVGKVLLKDCFPEFVGSTPSIVYNHVTDQLIVCQRYVNYWINDKGGYENREHITTKNVIAVFDCTDSAWVKTDEFLMDYDASLDNRYVGLEDVRLFMDGNVLKFNANRGINTHNMMIEHGVIDLATHKTTSGFVLIDNQRMIEKNWVLFNDKHGKNKVVYEWYPMKIGDVEDHSDPVDSDDEGETKSFMFNKTHDIHTPAFFKSVRGSTNGITIGDEIWFLCHLVSYEDRRFYYHLFVVIDRNTFALKKYSPLFTFEKQKVEYSLGFIYLPTANNFIIGYSKMDKETDYLKISKHAIDNMMILFV